MILFFIFAQIGQFYRLVYEKHFKIYVFVWFLEKFCRILIWSPWAAQFVVLFSIICRGSSNRKGARQYFIKLCIHHAFVPTNTWMIYIRKHFQLTELQLKRSREKLRNLCSLVWGELCGWLVVLFSSSAANIIANTLCTLMITADSFSVGKSMKRLFASFAGALWGNYCCAVRCRTGYLENGGHICFCFFGRRYLSIGKGLIGQLFGKILI